MRGTRSIFLSFFLLAPFLSEGQVSPLFTQYMFDPYLINPSLLSTVRTNEINLLYRRQWTGIPDGPETIQFDYQHAFNNKLTVGTNALYDKTILLSKTVLMATFGYRVPLAKDHILGFGLSAGVLSNRINLEDIPDIDSTDPVILTSSANNVAFDAQFGIHYSFRRLLVGFSLLNLIDHTTFSPETLQEIQFSQLKHKIIFASYIFNISSNFALQPNFLYRVTADDLNYYEASAIFTYKGLVSVGGGYRQDFGPTAMARVNVKDFQLGFAYDLPSNKVSVSTGGTNEVQLKWRFGKTLDKLVKKEEPKKEKVAVVHPVKEEPAPKKEVIEEPKKEVTPVVIAPVVIQEQPKQEEPVVVAPKLDPPPTYLLVVGAFKKESNASKLLAELKKNGFEAEVKKGGASYYYVHVPKLSTDSISLEKIQEIRNSSPSLFGEAWFMKVEP